MRFIHTILPAGLMAFTITAQAVPNMWSSGFGMGITEYIITSPEQVMLNLSLTTRISCSTTSCSPCRTVQKLIHRMKKPP